MGVAQPIQRLSEAEYLERERLAETKSEFFEGEALPMGRCTPAHCLVAANVIGELGGSLKGRPCLVFGSDLRIKIEATGLFTYPDASVVCGPPKVLDAGNDTLLNPNLILEVLSDATEAYDRGRKFEHYRQITSLREYLLLSQREPRADLFVRQAGGQWLLREAAGLSSTIELPELKVTLSLSEVYANVQLLPTPLRARLHSDRSSA